MLVNENRLGLADPAARKYLMGQTEQYFFGTGADAASDTVPPAARLRAEIRPAPWAWMLSILCVIAAINSGLSAYTDAHDSVGTI